MALQMLCLICDGMVDTQRQGNLVTSDVNLRTRVEKVIGSGLENYARCISLCEGCEGSLQTIEEYYRHVEHFRATFANTLSKYGETLVPDTEHDVGDNPDTAGQEEAFETKQDEGEGGNDPNLLDQPDDSGGGSGAKVVGSPTWTICLQAKDGSLVPIQQGAPLVMADNQVVLETVTVESSEVADLGNQSQHDAVANTEGEAESTAIGAQSTTETADNNVEISEERMVHNVVEPSPPPPKPLFICARCNLPFPTGESLVQHERDKGHHGGYNYKCSVCGNLYARLDSLRDHMCQHTGEKPHECGTCGECFALRNQLSRHRSLHYHNEQSLSRPLPHPTIQGTGPGSDAQQQQQVEIAVTVEGGENAESGLIMAATEKQDGSMEGGDGPSGETIIVNESKEEILRNSTQNLQQQPKTPLISSAEGVPLVPAASMKNLLLRNDSDLGSQLQRMLSSDAFHVVETQAGNMHLIRSPFSCPKCHEAFHSHISLRRHQCPMLSQQFLRQYTCPKCTATFVKRSLLERHRCPSLFLPENQQSWTDVVNIAPKAEQGEEDSQTGVVVQGNEGSVSMEMPAEGEEQDALVNMESDQTSKTDRQIEDESVYVQENLNDINTAQENDNTGLTNAHEDRNTPEGVILSENPSNEILAQPTDQTTCANPILEATSESAPVVSVSKVLPNTCSDNSVGEAARIKSRDKSVGTPGGSFRRSSSRVAGKVNPILEAMKKKTKGSCDVVAEVSAGGTNKTLDQKNSASGEAASEAPQTLCITETPTTMKQGCGDTGKLVTPEVVPLKRGRGRPRKIRPDNINPDIPAPISISDKPSVPDTSIQIDTQEVSNHTQDTEAVGDKPESCTPKRDPGRPLKRKRGRPRKTPLREDDQNQQIKTVAHTSEGSKVAVQEPASFKRKRGRPKKYPHPPQTSEMPPDKDNDGIDSSNKKSERDKCEAEKSPPNKRQKSDGDTSDKPDDTTVVNSDNHKVSQESSRSGRQKRIIKKRILVDYKEYMSDEELEEGEARSEKDPPTRDTPQKETPAKDTNPDKDINREVMGDNVKQEHAAKSNINSEPSTCPILIKPIKEEVDVENHEPLPSKKSRRRTFNSEFKCEPCARSFSSQLALDKHKTTSIHLKGLHTAESRKFVCKVCNRGFTRIDHLKDHSVNHTNELPYKCVVCERKFKFRAQLAQHRKSAHNADIVAAAMEKQPTSVRRFKERYKDLPKVASEAGHPKYQPEIIGAVMGKEGCLYRCKICSIVFNEVRLFNRHIVSHFNVKPFRCDICSKEFARADTLRTHKKVHYCNTEQEGRNVYLCDTCGKQFTRVEQLRNHVKVHFGERAWRCQECGKAFIDKYTLARHKIIHQADKPYLCATCGKGFNRRAHLEAHEAQHTGITLYQCEICDRGFSDVGNLSRHMLVHTDTRPWKCNVCGDSFKRKGNLNEHLATHDAKRRVVCDVCGARFTNKRYLRVHQLIHSGDRPHKCIVCSATFRQLSALITHKRIHTGDSPYACAHCHKRFKYYDQWKAHEHAHFDAKPYKCMLCSAAYRQAGSLRQHRKIVHGSQKGMVFLCTVCNKTFASTMSLDRHMRKVHNTEAALQSLQQPKHFVDDDATTIASTAATTSVITTPSTTNLVHITNPQGSIETIELTNLPTTSTATGADATNVLQLLGGQAALAGLSTQNGQITLTGGEDGALQLADGQRIVQLVTTSSVDGLPSTTQVLQVTNDNNGVEMAGQQVISLDSLQQLATAGSVLQYESHSSQQSTHQATILQVGSDGQIQVSEDGHIQVSADGQLQLADDGQLQITQDGQVQVTEDAQLQVTEDGGLHVEEDGRLKVEEDGRLHMTEDGQLQVTEDGRLQVTEDGRLQVMEDVQLQVEKNGQLQVTEDGRLQVKEDGQLQVEEDSRLQVAHHQAEDSAQIQVSQGNSHQFRVIDEGHQLQVSQDGQIQMSDDRQIHVSADGQVQILSTIDSHHSHPSKPDQMHVIPAGHVSAQIHVLPDGNNAGGQMQLQMSEDGQAILTQVHPSHGTSSHNGQSYTHIQQSVDTAETVQHHSVTEHTSFVDTTTGLPVTHISSEQEPSASQFTLSTHIPHQVVVESHDHASSPSLEEVANARILSGDENPEEVRTVTVDDSNSLSVVTIPQHRVSEVLSSGPTLGPIEVVPIETVTTELVTMETTMASEQREPDGTSVSIQTLNNNDVQNIDVIQSADVIQSSDIVIQGDDVINDDNSAENNADIINKEENIGVVIHDDIIHTEGEIIHGADIITETVPHELTDQEVVETVSIATTYDHVHSV